MTWHHDDLATDLAAHLRGNTDRIVWTDMQLGPMHSARPDVFTLQKSFTRFTPLVYEIKISTSDFRSDITSGKWQRYLEFASGVIFAVPAGLIGPKDVPVGCGLIVRGATGWRTTRKPTLSKIETLPRDAWVKLVIDGVTRAAEERRPRFATSWSLARDHRARLGADVADAVCDLDGVRALIKQRRLQADQILEQARERAQKEAAGASKELAELQAARIELCEALGLEPGASASRIRNAIIDAQRPVAEVARDALSSIEWARERLADIARGDAE